MNTLTFINRFCAGSITTHVMHHLFYKVDGNLSENIMCVCEKSGETKKQTDKIRGNRVRDSAIKIQ